MAISVIQTELKELLAIPATVADFAVAAEIATLQVTEDLASSGLSEDRQNKIALLLAAHYVTLGYFRGGLSSKEIGESRERYQDAVLGTGLESTLYGQQAIALDTTGTIKNVSTTRMKALFTVV